MGATLSYSQWIPTMMSRCRRRTQEIPMNTGDHIILNIDALQITMDKKIRELDQRQQIQQQQIQAYHNKLHDSIQQIESIKDKIHKLETIQENMMEDEVIIISS